MKKAIYIMSPILLLILFLIGYFIDNLFDEKGGMQAERYYRPMVMYNGEYYLIVSSGIEFDLSAEDLECVGVLSSDVSVHNLPSENMQSCGVEYLVGQNIYVTDKYTDYLFIYNKDGVLIPFVLESAR